MALAACKGHMYRLRLNRCVQAYLLKAIEAGAFAQAVTNDT
jgi:hypothetical protein